MRTHSVLSEYNPIKRLSLPGAELVDPSGIVVLVGPNSSGKTLLLRDIERHLLTGQAEHIVCTGIDVRRPPDGGALIDELIERMYIRKKPGQPNQYQTFIPFLGTVLPYSQQKGRASFQVENLRKACEALESDPKAAASFFGAIGQALVAPLSLEDRWRVCAKTKTFDHRQLSPDFPLQGLLVNSPAQIKLAEETGRVFGNTVWMETLTEPGFTQLRVSGTPDFPPREATIDPFEASKYRGIESEGDGFRSYVGICLSLLMGIKPVALVDEPELCLHPPQAYRIGQFIGNHATQSAHVTVVATHSSHVLRGILEASSGTKIAVVRMSRKEGEFRARKVAEGELVDCIRNPRTRAEAVLDGLFARGVVLVESDGDREVYQAAFESVEDYAAREIHFVPVGGTGGFADPCRFYRRLEIPAAMIADLDAACDPPKMAPCVEALGDRREDVAEITEALKDLARRVKDLPPSITGDEVRVALKSLLDLPMDWKKGDDNTIRRTLGQLEGRIRRLQRLKEGGVDAYADNPKIRSALEILIRRCGEIGLFFVPGGELESWVPDLMTDCPRRMNKIQRAALAASKIRSADVKEGDIWAFCRSVFAFLKAEQDG